MVVVEDNSDNLLWMALLMEVLISDLQYKPVQSWESEGQQTQRLPSVPCSLAMSVDWGKFINSPKWYKKQSQTWWDLNSECRRTELNPPKSIYSNTLSPQMTAHKLLWMLTAIKITFLIIVFVAWWQPAFISMFNINSN